MARFTEEEAAALLKATGRPVLSKRPCDTCKKMYMPTSGTQKDCPKCRIAKGADRLRSWKGVNTPPKKKRGERGKTGEGRANLKPDDSGPGVVNSCPMCGAMYDPTETASRGCNRQQWTTIEHGVGFDYFECFCNAKKGHEYTRYK